MTHNEFIALMEQNESGKAIFEKYKQLYSKYKKPMGDTLNVGYFMDNNEHITIVEKLLQHHRDCVEKLASFANLKKEDCEKVLSYLEEEAQ
ncbi:MAG: hypothetical protein M0D57_13555 [Sphingobacteriales bacterium JAD_PAG50586_3]|nr:MAG: hypothetical protein M0D57_13555 [Sphingobacteriales bacterium JAD_PAG50586_3]